MTTNQTKTTTIRIEDRGIMLSDYFSGTSGVMIPLYIDKHTTIREILEMFKGEIDMLWDYVQSTAEYHNFKPINDLEKAIDAQVKIFEQDVNQKHQNLDVPLDSSLDWSFREDDPDYSELEETPILILTIEFN